MTNELRVQASTLFEKLADDQLDLTEAQHEEAVQHYKAVADWLNREESAIAEFKPDIYPQGSFRLGTVVKPQKEDDQYDIDLVCELRSINQDKITQDELKKLVGDRLKENETYKNMLEEPKRRCWTLKYSEDSRFHMDILPAISDSNRAILAKRAGITFTIDPIWIADKQMQKWLRSNPKGYSAWFYKQMEAEQKRLAAIRKRAGVEEVPDFTNIKTPLQRSIQILKLHRNNMFPKKDDEDKPISIIITTLAALSYDDETDTVDALLNIINRMEQHIEEYNGEYWIPNPVDEQENFADKWQEYPQRKDIFFEWLEKVRVDLNTALQQRDIHALVESLQSHFGEKLIKTAYSKTFEPQRVSSASTRRTPPLDKIERKSRPWGK